MTSSSELKGAHIAAMIAGGETETRQAGAIEALAEAALNRDLDEIVPQMLRIPRRLREALDRTSTLTGKSKNVLITEAIHDYLRRFQTAEAAVRTRRERRAKADRGAP